MRRDYPRRLTALRIAGSAAMAGGAICLTGGILPALLTAFLPGGGESLGAARVMAAEVEATDFSGATADHAPSRTARSRPPRPATPARAKAESLTVRNQFVTDGEPPESASPHAAAGPSRRVVKATHSEQRTLADRFRDFQAELPEGPTSEFADSFPGEQPPAAVHQRGESWAIANEPAIIQNDTTRMQHEPAPTHVEPRFEARPPRDRAPDQLLRDPNPQRVQRSVGVRDATSRSMSLGHGDTRAASTTADGVVAEWHVPSTVNLGQEVPCRVVVRNDAPAAALKVDLHVNVPENAELVRSQPAPINSGRLLTWRIGNLAPGQEKEIELVLVPTAAGDFAPTAAVTATRTATAQVGILDPRIEIEVSGDSALTFGQMAKVEIRVSNHGSGPATRVVLRAGLDRQLAHADGSQLEYSIGTLLPGESRQVVLPVTAQELGSAVIACVAEADGCQPAAGQFQVHIMQPELELALSGPQRRFVDRPADYTVTVYNPGPAPAENVQVFHHVPEGFRFLKAAEGGSYDPAAGQVAWFLGRVEAGQTAELNLRLVADQPGEHRLAARVKADAGVDGSAVAATRIEGASALVLEVTDADDPVEVGGETSYEVRVSNRGTSAAHNVQLAVRAPAELQLLDSDGPTRGTLEGERIVFDPLATLAPGETRVYHVRVACQGEGRVRFRAYVRSDDDPEPILEEEPTHVYAD